MTVEQRIDIELARIRPEFTPREWFILRDVIAAAFRRLLENPYGHS
jgi:hypothetical protein